MFQKFLTYMHLNGLHGNVKYYKYLFDQMDFENQLMVKISDFRRTKLRPILLTYETYTLEDEKPIGGIIKGVCCTQQLTNPYVREIQLATDYLFDMDDFSAEHRKEIRTFILNNFKCIETMNNYFNVNQITIEAYEYEEIFKVLLNDYKELLDLENLYCI
ncbi:hypothetical protein [Parapoynx stagnalis nucleopolyhedrovirus]|uniref:Uncharacterized protein n=1 Tax=Parapoynx stagnalis nucleopolyhedrovirus TaxID=2993413 RepID=A0A9E7Y5V1_9ABAC|nr:hypothetical protein [Parapoynx stagnalis nucleopolyhedrovirus]